MCGIVGLWGPQEDSWIETMNAIQAHRGPDDSGVFRDRNARVSLAMRRLAIIDLADGHQPMVTADGRHTIVFNGEIYNAPDLRAELEARGVQFATGHSDTEVVLQFYAREGADMLPRLNGMFAFAIYDRDRKTLFCARDRVGIKPFYYLDHEGRFAFASEIKSLLGLPFVSRTVNRQSLFHYMSLMYVPGPETMFQGIHRLPAGHCLTVDLESGSRDMKAWWRLPFARAAQPTSQTDLAAAVRDGLDAAVKRWMLSDVPVGCLLSGGLDSSAIVSLLARDGIPVKTYTLGFTGPGEETWSELPLARAVAEKWGTEHHEIVLDPQALLDDLPTMVWHMDEAYGGGLPSWSVFKFMSRNVKVALSGTGGDELFGNYHKYREMEGGAIRRLMAKPATLPSADRFRRDFFEAHYYGPDDWKRQEVFAADFGETRDTADLLHQHFSAGNTPTLRDRSVRTDFETQLPEEFLAMTDRFSMAHGIEARTPFLDHKFVEQAMGIPATERLNPRDYKRLLRLAVKELLPAELLNAPKKGFVIPLKPWLRTQLRATVETLLSPERLKKQGLFRPEFFRSTVAPHLNGRADNTSRVWGALMFQIWYSVFLESDPAVCPAWDVRAFGE